MKKLGIFVLTAVLALSMVACRSRNDTQQTEPTVTATTPETQPETAPATIPTMPEVDPTLDTNIPDPSVNDNSTSGMEDNLGESQENAEDGQSTENGTEGRMRMFR